MYDVIVIGGGHAGVEAALATAKMNFKTLMRVGSVKRIASMPCNPSIWGPAKGVILREIDALKMPIFVKFKQRCLIVLKALL